MRRLLRPLVLALALAACATERAPETAIDRATFLETYVELRRAAVETGGGADFEARKAEILQRHGTSEEELRQFLDAHADDPDYLASLWEEVAERTRPAEEAPAPSAPPPAP